MKILVILIMLSLALYVYYKIKYVRSRMPMEKKMLNGKSSLALGSFVGLYGINQLFVHGSTTAYIVGAVFILIGGFSAWVGYRSYRHHVPYAIREAEEIAKQTK